jgi:hypothetical protein
MQRPLDEYLLISYSVVSYQSLNHITEVLGAQVTINLISGGPKAQSSDTGNFITACCNYSILSLVVVDLSHNL